MVDILYKRESYEIIGICMEVHRELGMGFKEIVYKDALAIELKSKAVPFEREKKYKIYYKGNVLPRGYYADFVIGGTIILEVKATSQIINPFLYQTINYLKAAGLRLGIIVNFGEKSLSSKRVIF